ncbi:putative necrosis-inducing factor-domain-containing protein [Triangularia verruculosa]|uniref:Necrosis-inducing factor-domain-containing protein n=1 Tax=Triangularia verruculosa TaxID=2587418 RepID=A0AAN6XGW6_9PEZI|nr:putative necrosis-inducing factor-domain-containing protein [Triangularia verruculosa]
MQLFKPTKAVLGLVLAAAAMGAPATNGNKGNVQIPEGFTEVSEGVYYRNSSSPGISLAAEIHHCQISDTDGRTDEISALVDDCLQVYRDLAYDAEWVILGGRQKLIASYGTCWIGITVSRAIDSVTVGNVDLHTAVFESITWYAKSFPDGKGGQVQRVGAYGWFHCGYNFGDACSWIIGTR